MGPAALGRGYAPQISDPFDLRRFITAQDDSDAYATALAELRGGLKRTHWMWFVFPQLRGLGSSATARHFAISGIKEARAYLAHPVLGPRLRQCAQALLDLTGHSAAEVVGQLDALKLRSSMTLFLLADPTEPVFAEVLERYFGGQLDLATQTGLPST